MLIAQAKLTPLIVETSGAALRLPPSAVTVASWGLTVAPARGRGIMAKPVLSKEELRAQLEAALANYHGPVTHCPPAPRPEPEPEERDLDDDERECETADALPLAR